MLALTEEGAEALLQEPSGFTTCNNESLVFAGRCHEKGLRADYVTLTQTAKREEDEKNVKPALVRLRHSSVG